jgi:hypothetical protein
MTATGNTPPRGDNLLLEHVQMLESGAQLQPPQGRLSDSVGPALAGLLVHALRGDRGAPRSGLRV